MKTDESIIGIVIESYTHGENQVVVVHCPDAKIHRFFYLPKHPDINFGDFLLMNFHTDRFRVSYGSPHLTYRIFPLVFPGTLLWELILERTNN